MRVGKFYLSLWRGHIEGLISYLLAVGDTLPKHQLDNIDVKSNALTKDGNTNTNTTTTMIITTNKGSNNAGGEEVIYINNLFRLKLEMSSGTIVLPAPTSEQEKESATLLLKIDNVVVVSDPEDAGEEGKKRAKDNITQDETNYQVRTSILIYLFIYF